MTIPFFLAEEQETRREQGRGRTPRDSLEYFRPPKMRSALKGTTAQHFCHYRVIFTGTEGPFGVKDGRICVRRLTVKYRETPWNTLQDRAVIFTVTLDG